MVTPEKLRAAFEKWRISGAFVDDGPGADLRLLFLEGHFDFVEIARELNDAYPHG